ncbi:MAG: glycerophosphodiester phosphodiesterase [Halioglobus sp.]
MQTIISGFLQAIHSRWPALLQVHLIFNLLGAVILGPVFGLLLQTVVGFSGSAAVADQDIARLLLTPLGASSAVFLVGIFLAITALEIGALLVVALAMRYSLACTPLQASIYAIHRALGLLDLTLQLTLRVGARTVPLLVVVGATAWFLLTEHDINFYLAEKPTQFWWALSVTLVSVAIYVWFVARLLMRWCLALPLILFGDQSGSAALLKSEALVAGRISEVFRAYAVCLVIAALIAVIPYLLFNLVGGWVMTAQYDQLASLVFMLGCLVVVWLVINFFVVALALTSVAFVTGELYDHFGAAIGKEDLQAELRAQPRFAKDRGLWRVMLVMFAVAGMAVFAGSRFLDIVKLEDASLIVAHRGAAGAAPENTLAAVRRAIADGADWVEIDVQESRDGYVVVFHDSDFMKLTGNPLKVWNSDLAEIQRQDIGSWFSSEFAGEKVPTLQQVLEEVRGRSRLMIELKYYGHDQRLEQRVVDIVESAGMADQVVVMSLKLAGVQKLQALRPDWTVGLLAATAMGDLSKVDVDFLALSGRMVTSRLIRRVQNSGKRILVWTVNDAPSMSRWISMGVDGVITDEPALARKVLVEREDMTTAERLMVSASLFFGKPVAPNTYRDNSP